MTETHMRVKEVQRVASSVVHIKDSAEGGRSGRLAWA